MTVQEPFAWLVLLASMCAGLSLGLAAHGALKSLAARRARAALVADSFTPKRSERRRRRAGLIFLFARVGALARQLPPGKAGLDKLASAGLIDSTEQLLARGGYGESVHAPDLLAGRVLIAAGLVVLYMLGLGTNSAMDLGFALALGALAYQFPMMRARNAARKRSMRIRAALAPAVDILAVAVAGGATLDQGIELYCGRFDGPLADELQIARREMAIGRSRRDALNALAGRCDTEPVRSFVGAILQSDRFGTPISQTLRAQSEQIKIQRRQMMQEQVAKAPVRMLLPMGAFVVPSLLIVLLGPALLQIAQDGLF